MFLKNKHKSMSNLNYLKSLLCSGEINNVDTSDSELMNTIFYFLKKDDAKQYFEEKDIENIILFLLLHCDQKYAEDIMYVLIRQTGALRLIGNKVNHEKVFDFIMNNLSYLYKASIDSTIHLSFIGFFEKSYKNKVSKLFPKINNHLYPIKPLIDYDFNVRQLKFTIRQDYTFTEQENYDNSMIFLKYTKLYWKELDDKYPYLIVSAVDTQAGYVRFSVGGRNTFENYDDFLNKFSDMLNIIITVNSLFHSYILQYYDEIKYEVD
jgi:hypothetical protein